MVAATGDSAQDRNFAQLIITINSDGNVIEFVSYQDKVYTYRYTKSNTKMNTTISFTEENFKKFLHRNSQIKEQEFIQYNPHP